MTELTQEDIKAALKDGIKEWMDEKFSVFGKWTARAVGVMLIGAITYFILKMNGWVKAG